MSSAPPSAVPATADPTASQTSLADNLSTLSSDSPHGSRIDVRRISFARERSGSRRRSNQSSPVGESDSPIAPFPEVARSSSNSVPSVLPDGKAVRRISSPPPPRYVLSRVLTFHLYFFFFKFFFFYLIY
jgi:hypothetical protein